MRLKTLSGQLRYKNCAKYKIKWDKQERSQFQTDVKAFLRPFISHHIVYSEFPVFSTLLKIDIYDATSKVAYEVSGLQHIKFSEHFHKGSRNNFLGQIRRDINKAKFCEINDIKLVEIFPDDLPLTKQWFKEKYDVDL